MFFKLISGERLYSRLFRRHAGRQVRQDGFAEGDAGQELRQVRPDQVHSPGGPGHDSVRLSVDAGDVDEPQVPVEPRGRSKASLRKALAQEKEVDLIHCDGRTNTITFSFAFVHVFCVKIRIEINCYFKSVIVLT